MLVAPTTLTNGEMKIPGKIPKKQEKNKRTEEIETLRKNVLRSNTVCYHYGNFLSRDFWRFQRFPSEAQKSGPSNMGQEIIDIVKKISKTSELSPVSFSKGPSPLQEARVT